MLRWRGDEDRSTQGARRRALAQAIAAERSVTVELNELVFADTSVMVDLAVLARRLRVGGHSVLLRGGPPQISTLIELVGLHRLPGIRLDGPSPALT